MKSSSAGDLREMESQIDWEAPREKTDEEIEQAVREDPNAVLRAYVAQSNFKAGSPIGADMTF